MSRDVAPDGTARRLPIAVLSVVACLAAAVRFGFHERPPAGEPTADASPPPSAARDSEAAVEAPLATATADRAPAVADRALASVPATERRACCIRVTRFEDATPVERARVRLQSGGAKLAEGVTGADGYVTFDGLEDVPLEIETRAAGRVPAWCPVSDVRWSDSGHATPVASAVHDSVLPVTEVVLFVGVPLSGTVVLADDGVGVGGVAVTAVRGGLPDDRPGTDPEPPDHAGPPICSTESDALGRFQLDAWPEGRSVTLIAAKAGFVTSETVVRVAPASDVAPAIVLRVRRGAGAAGRVRDAEGAPIDGASVYAVPAEYAEMLVRPWSRHDDPATYRQESFAAPTTVTDSAGNYVLDVLDPERTWFVVAFSADRAAASAPSEVGVGVAGTTVACDLLVRHFVAFDGVVELPGDVAAEGLTVRCVNSGEAAVIERQHFRFERLLPGLCRLEVVADGLAPRAFDVEVEAGPHEQLILRYVVEPRVAAAQSPDDQLDGFVQDDLGAPVAGATVYVTAEDDAPRPVRITTDDRGRFSLRGIDRRRHRVEAVHDGHASVHVTVQPPSHGLVLEMPRMAALRFELPEGAAVEQIDRCGVLVTSTDALGRLYSTGSLARGDAEDDREFRVTDVRPGAVEILIGVPGFAPVRFTFDAQPGEYRDLGALALDPGGQLAGRVTDATGAPILKATVVAEGFGDRVSLDQDGRFVLSHVGREGVLSVALEGGRYVHRRFEVRPGTTNEMIIRVPDLVTVNGRVTQDGRPVAGAVVRVLPESTDDYQVEVTRRTDADGRFDLRVPPGPHRVVVTAPGLARTTARLDAVEGGATDLHVQMEAR